MNNLLSLKSLELLFQLYKRDLNVLNKVDLKIFKGEKIAVVGESGSGKSVMLRIILGLLNYRNAIIKGDVLFESVNLREKDDYYYRQHIRGKNISIIFLHSKL